MIQNTEIIARGVQLSTGSVLLARKRGEGHAFLPGGHILFGESARSALEREIVEELGKSLLVQRFLGVAEHAWESEGVAHHELNLVFKMAVEGLDRECPPASMERHLEFLWQPLGELKAVNLQPYPLQKLLRSWLESEVEVGWASSVCSPGKSELRRT